MAGNPPQMTSSPICLRFEEMGATSAFEQYDSLVVHEMHPADFVAADELKELIRIGEVSAWMVWHDGLLIGHCAVITRSPLHPDPDAVHILTIVIFGSAKGHGYGTSILHWLTERYAGCPLTASLQGVNFRSKRLFARAGFFRGLEQRPWFTWRRPPGGRDGAPQHVLVRTNCSSDMVGSELAEAVFAEVMASLRSKGHYVEGSTSRAPAMAVPDPSRPWRQPYAWPDPAAFHLVIDVHPTGARDAR